MKMLVKVSDRHGGTLRLNASVEMAHVWLTGRNLVQYLNWVGNATVARNLKILCRLPPVPHVSVTSRTREPSQLTGSRLIVRH